MKRVIKGFYDCDNVERCLDVVALVLFTSYVVIWGCFSGDVCVFG